MAAIDHASFPGESYALTIRDDAVMMLETSFTLDGAPMVSYEFFERIP